jgi:UDP-N-acetylglucosamine diphosphorylase / glucose-1-phosphate thymidylyltransferase / UDP-N-acetylgalactosamine diphosphorylase / glucosamine-1-phosphate N-acetyltransferase / galactosamine-1-phosphate N-acetyltransferase
MLKLNRIHLPDFIKSFPLSQDLIRGLQPWEIIENLEEILQKIFPRFNEDYLVDGDLAIHRSATIEPGSIVKGHAIISAHCFIGSGAYLRGGVYLAEHVSIGPGCEIKSSVVAHQTSLAHFNYIGNSLIGSNVNFEAGSVIANHYNERDNKRIYVKVNDEIIDTGTEKFGALVGDHSRIGANAVLSPGTILNPGYLVKRLELIEQLK